MSNANSTPVNSANEAPNVPAPAAGSLMLATGDGFAGGLDPFAMFELEALYDRAPLGLALLDANLCFVRINQALADMNGASPAKHIGRRVWDIVPHLRSAAEPMLMAVLETGVARSDVLVSGQTPAQPGVTRSWREQFYPVKDAGGRVVGVGVICEEITNTEMLKQELELREKQLRRILDGCNAMIGVIAPDGTLLEANLPALVLSGLEREAVIGLKFWECPWWSHDAAEQSRLRDAITTCAAGEQVRFDAEIAIAHGRTMWIDFMISPVFDSDGNVELLVPSAFDISGRKKDERHRELMIDELNHRVKNTLAIVQSMANQTLRAGGDRDQQLVAFRGRLGALARAMDLLTDAQWQTTSFSELIRETLSAAAAPMPRTTMAGPPIHVAPKAAVSIAMAFHELATNAIKYGAWSNDTGFVDVVWSVRDTVENGIEIIWQERGGPPVAAPQDMGFGSRMIERVLSDEISGTAKLHFHDHGVRCEIIGALPVSVIAAHYSRQQE